MHFLVYCNTSVIDVLQIRSACCITIVIQNVFGGLCGCCMNVRRYWCIKSRLVTPEYTITPKSTPKTHS